MSVYLHPQRNRWVYDFEFRKKRRSGYCIDPDTNIEATNKSSARKAETKIKARIMAKADDQVLVNPNTFTFGQAASSYATQTEGTKIWVSRKTHLRELLSFFEPGTPVQAISEARIHDYIAWSRKQTMLVWRGGPRKPQKEEREIEGMWVPSARKRTDATINRYLDCLRKVLKVASRFSDPLTGAPLLPRLPKVPKLREVERMPNPVPAATILKMMKAAPDYLKDAIMLAAFTGMRKAEMLNRTVADYRPDLQVLRIKGEDTKGKRDEMIPLSAAAVEVIERRIKAAKKAKVQWLFFWTDHAGKHHQLKDPRRSWKSAVAAAGAERYRFHDLKASFLTAVSMVNPGLAGDLGRHKSPSTTKRYIRHADIVRKQVVEDVAAQVLNITGSRVEKAAKSHTKVPYGSAVRTVKKAASS